MTSRNDLNRTLPGGDSSRVITPRAWLRFGEQDYELSQGHTIIGRSPHCQIVLDDPLVSRNHARIDLDKGVVTIEDLGSANGVLLNGERLTIGPRAFASGDRAVIGQQTFLLFVVSAHRDAHKERRAHAQTLTSMASFTDDDDRNEPTRKGDAIDLLIGVADKVLALGRGEEAERILSAYLKNLLQVSKTRGEVDAVLAEKAGTYAVRIAEATGKGSWVDYLLELYTVTRRPLPAAVVDRLYESVRKLSPISGTVYREYLSVLRAQESLFGPAERFLMRRVEGLESLGALK